MLTSRTGPSWGRFCFSFFIDDSTAEFSDAMRCFSWDAEPRLAAEADWRAQFNDTQAGLRGCRARTVAPTAGYQARLMRISGGKTIIAPGQVPVRRTMIAEAAS